MKEVIVRAKADKLVITPLESLTGAVESLTKEGAFDFGARLQLHNAFESMDLRELGSELERRMMDTKFGVSAEGMREVLSLAGQEAAVSISGEML